MNVMTAGRMLTLALLLAGLAGCTVTPVKPWQRAHLASPAMAWEMRPQVASYRQHVEVSKEAASGGNGLGGNACGCN